MPIPSIDSYAVPEPREANRVDWQLDPARCAVLVHDMQRYFLAAYDRSADPAASAVTNMTRIVEDARTHGVPVIYSAQPGDQHPHRRGLLREFWGTGMTEGEDTEIIPELAPREGDMVLTKWRYSAFQRTDLRQILSHLQRDQLVILGVYGHMGCQVTATEAFMHDIQAFLVSDAIADFSREEHQDAVDYVAKRCGAVLSTGDVLAAWDASAASSDPAERTVQEAARV